MINISRKDRLMILLIAVSLIIFWLLGVVLNSVFDGINIKNSELSKLKNSDDSSWLNTSRALTIDDFKNRIVIVHFFSQSCFSCIQDLDAINEFNKEMGNRIAIIGVNSPKFLEEKSSLAARKAVLRYNIEHSVLLDSDESISSSFNIQEWPTYLLFDVDGDIVKTYNGAGSVKKVIKKASKLITRNRFSLNSKSLPIVLEKNDIELSVLSYPTKIIFVPNFQFKSRNFPALVIADSGHNSIVITNLKGEIIQRIGSQKSGLIDGDFEITQFNNPQGILYSKDKIYVADTGNHSLRIADLKNNHVKTIIGDGFAGFTLDQNPKTISVSSDFQLNSPTDIEFLPDTEFILIANSGTNQILSYDQNSQKISVFAGNGKSQTIDGKFPENSLSQPVDIAVFNKKIYLLDSLSSSLRVLDKDGNLKTLLSGNPFGSSKNHSKGLSLQSPRALYVDDTGIYIADTLNHKIRKYDFGSLQLSELFGAKRGDGVGNNLTLDEPHGLVAMFDRIFIADTNNNRIVVANRGSRSSELLDVIPTSNTGKLAFLEFLPDPNQELEVSVKENQKIDFSIKLSSDKKFNEKAPIFLNFIQINDGESAILLDSFNSSAVKANKIKLPELKIGEKYMLYGKIYYCKEGKNSLCFVKSYQQPVIAKDGEENSKIEFKL